MSNPPLPQGWIQKYDSNHGRPYWVDTSANPPRSIWVHPYEDEQFLAAHPEARATDSDLDAPPSYDVATESTSGTREKLDTSDSQDVVTGESSHRRGVFGRLKDKAIGTKEERDEHKRIKAEQAARAEERARQARRRELAEREERRRIRAEQAARAEERARQARRRELAEREAYMQAYGGYAPYRPSYTEPQRGFGGDNTATLLLGGLVGGLLLGDIFGGGF